VVQDVRARREARSGIGTTRRETDETDGRELDLRMRVHDS